MAAAACLDVLVTLLSVVREEPAIMQRLGQQSLPLAVAIFDPEQQLLEFFDTGITLLEWLVCVLCARSRASTPPRSSSRHAAHRLSFGMPELGPQFWDAYCALIDCYHRFAIDYAPNMVVVVDHYMARATDVMVTQGRNGQSYVDMALGMLPKALNKGWSTEAGAACMITQSTFFHCRGRVDDKVPGTLSVLMNGLADAHTKVQALHPETGAEEGTPSITDVEVLRVRLRPTPRTSHSAAHVLLVHALTPVLCAAGPAGADRRGSAVLQRGADAGDAGARWGGRSAAVDGDHRAVAARAHHDDRQEDHCARAHRRVGSAAGALAASAAGAMRPVI